MAVGVTEQAADRLGAVGVEGDSPGELSEPERLSLLILTISESFLLLHLSVDLVEPPTPN